MMTRICVWCRPNHEILPPKEGEGETHGLCAKAEREIMADFEERQEAKP